MKQKILVLPALLLSVFLTSSCIFSGPTIRGNGNVVEEKRKVDDFNEIKVSRGMNVYISQGNDVKVIVKADENLLDAIETKIEGHALKITTNSNIRKATTKKVFVTTPGLKAIKSSTGSNVFSETVLEFKNMEVFCSAGSNIKLDVKSEGLNVSATAGSNIKLEGRTKVFYGKASSGSNIKAEELYVVDCTAKTSSGANLWITAKNSFEGHSSSGGNIFYYGNPKSTDINKSSGGNVIKK